jgi:hypothetical protein
MGFSLQVAFANGNSACCQPLTDGKYVPMCELVCGPETEAERLPSRQPAPHAAEMYAANLRSAVSER